MRLNCATLAGRWTPIPSHMDYDLTNIPATYDLGHDHGPAILEQWMTVIESGDKRFKRGATNMVGPGNVTVWILCKPARGRSGRRPARGTGLRLLSAFT